MIVLLLLLAHLIADFWLQTDLMVKNKIKYLNKHIFHHLITTGLTLTIIFGYHYHFTNIFGHLVFPIIFICATHIIIDLLKLKLLDTIKTTDTDSLKKLVYFLLDQLLHIAIILITCNVFFDMKATIMINKLLENNGASSLGLANILLLIIIIFILATSVSGHIVKILVGSLPSNLANFEGEFTINNKTQEVNNKIENERDSYFTEEYHYFTYSNPLHSRGRLIGYIERLLVISLTIVGAYPSIAFIIAAKSIARFKQLDDRNWAEYFLLGTLSSIFLGLLLGIIVKEIVM